MLEEKRGLKVLPVSSSKSRSCPKRQRKREEKQSNSALAIHSTSS